jgi:hypothetical protein
MTTFPYQKFRHPLFYWLLFPFVEHSSMSITRTCEYCDSIGLPDGNGGTKKLRKCGRCYRIRYCNREHQKADHQRHKPECLGAEGWYLNYLCVCVHVSYFCFLIYIFFGKYNISFSVLLLMTINYFHYMYATALQVQTGVFIKQVLS